MNSEITGSQLKKVNVKTAGVAALCIYKYVDRLNISDQ